MLMSLGYKDLQDSTSNYSACYQIPRIQYVNLQNLTVEIHLLPQSVYQNMLRALH
ncbi:hypothetical protein QQP08_016058 [Theobroma cacao]|nr:hypothetical protein QQP08_016058 [Theobroma cacao]